MSPLLFVLALEPLAARIQASPEIVGFKRGYSTDVVSLQGSLQAVMALVGFGDLS